jgi:transcription-repair coupling factor (superfamily II helicase)
MRENVDIITMSATPIPQNSLYVTIRASRTCLSLTLRQKTGLPIKTFVGEFNEPMVKNAIVHEMDREGQVFYLYNRVETILRFQA